MAGDIGNQTVTIKYQDRVDSPIVNARCLNIRPAGIYIGGYLSITGANTVSVSPLECEIGDGTYQVKVKTGSAVTVTCTKGSAEVVILRWTYTGSASQDYMELLATNSPAANDLIVGKVVYTGAAITSVTYGDSTYPRTTPNVQRLFLKVQPTETPGSSVRVRAGRAHTGSTFQEIADQTLSLAAYSSGDVIYIYINDTGGLAHSKTVSDYAGMAFVAKVTYPADGIINEDDIEDARCFVDSPAIPDGTTACDI